MIRQIPVLLDPINVKGLLVTLHFYLQISAKNVLTTIVQFHFIFLLCLVYPTILR